MCTSGVKAAIPQLNWQKNNMTLNDQQIQHELWLHPLKTLALGWEEEREGIHQRHVKLRQHCL